jgi:HAD superfamily hydrolase (TIGR01484 family)
MQDSPLTASRSNFVFDRCTSVDLIATDLDGTLTRHGRFTPELLQALEALQTAGIPVLITTGRSAGWVQGLVHYLPVWGAIAENGGLVYPHGSPPHWITPIADVTAHRQALAQMFATLQAQYPELQESSDNAVRCTDWTFDVAGLDDATLDAMGDRCRAAGWGFTYSTVQCHIRPAQQNKGQGLLAVLADQFPHIPPERVLTVGDSPNDQELFQVSPLGVGVANIQPYLAKLEHRPAYLTPGEEIDGFLQVAQALLQSRQGSQS